MFKSKPSKQELVHVGILDDEPSSIEQLKNIIEQYHENVHVSFEAATLEQAKSLLKEHAIDILFLDVQLADGSTGFDLLGEINDEIRVIFATGYDQYAVRAFEVNALDYILKPIQADRLERALEVFFNKEKQNKTLPMIRRDDDVLLKEDHHAAFVPIKNIQYIESDRDYTKVYTADRTWYVRKPISQWEDKLPTTLFLRIHRSIIANMEHVTSVQKKPTGSYQLTLAGIDRILTSSRRYGSRLKRFLASKTD